MALRISAVICTHDRAPYLRKALGSLAAQTLPAESYEILVVDNASADDTARVVREEFRHLPGLHYLLEPELGLSRARNLGWQRAAAPLVAYLDDDAIAPRDWLERILGAFDAVTPTPGCVGGPIDPIWEVPRPAWLPDSLLELLTVLDLSDEPTWLPEGCFLFGTNMAAPRQVLAAVGGYQLSLGAIGKWHRTGEDTFLQKQIRRAGHAIYYDPAIRVRHHVHAARVCERWLLKRMYWEGLNRARQTLIEEAPGRRARLRLVLTALHKLTSSPRRLLALALPVHTPAVFRRKAASCRRLGFLMGVLGAGR